VVASAAEDRPHRGGREKILDSNRRITIETFQSGRKLIVARKYSTSSPVHD